VRHADDDQAHTALELWRKLLLMAPMGALSAMTRVPLRRIREEADTWRLAEQGMREVVAVANAEGVGLDAADVELTLAFVRGMSATWKGSLTFDLEQGRRLEVDSLSGAVCRRARRPASTRRSTASPSAS
jgi:2-dehydropantoate 2-reductase